MTVQRGRTTGTVLDRILVRTAADLERRKNATPVAMLERLASQRHNLSNLKRSLGSDDLSVIAEVKRASPSKGAFAAEVVPGEVAVAYLQGGAAAISCLTDEPFFHGSLADLSDVADVAHQQAAPIPVLRKDFIIDTYQVIEAKAHGADAILLIVAALDGQALRDLRENAEAIGLQALVEIHDEPELQLALDSGASLIGINNRDLRTLTVDLTVTERLAPLVSSEAVVVAESGIFTVEDAKRMTDAGAHAILVGEALIVQPDRSGAVRRLRGGA